MNSASYDALSDADKALFAEATSPLKSSFEGNRQNGS